MTFIEFKDELFFFRDRQREKIALHRRLENVREEKLANLNPGAMDYSKERLQTSHDPDGSMVRSIYEIDEEEKYLKSKIDLLEERNKPMETLIRSVEGTEAVILYYYYIQVLGMKKIAEIVDYSEDSCWRFHRTTIRDLWEKEELKNAKRKV